MERLVARGAAEVVPEMLETSIMLATHTLALIGKPLARVVRRMRDIRSQRYSLMRGFFLGASDAEKRLDAQEARLHTLALPAGAWAVGKTIAELDLADVRVAAMRRQGVRSLDPEGSTHLQEGDVLVLLGMPVPLTAAENWILKGR